MFHQEATVETIKTSERVYACFMYELVFERSTICTITLCYLFENLKIQHDVLIYSCIIFPANNFYVTPIFYHL